MAKNTNSVCRMCRRENVKLFLKGTRCYSEKCSFNRRAYAPGQHGKARKKITQYAVQLREKQKLRRIYGVSESQFGKYFSIAERKKGITGEILIQTLESRFDNVIYRIGFASSRSHARQLISHRHFLVNGRRLNIPSYLVKPGDTIEAKEETRKIPDFQSAVNIAKQREAPSWLKMNLEKYSGEVISLPSLENLDLPVKEQLVVEFYSR